MSEYPSEFELFLVDLFFLSSLVLTLIWHAIERNPIILAKTLLCNYSQQIFFFETKTVIWLHLKIAPTWFWSKKKVV